MKKDTAVIGLGNILIADEGVGCVVVDYFLARQKDYPHVQFIDAGTGGMNLLHIIADREKVIIVDCALMGTEPGTIKQFTPEQVQSVKKLSHYSLHEADMLKIIEMSRELGQCPQEIVMFGIEPVRVAPGCRLSEVLSGRLSGYIKTIETELYG
jgi:hydrogenase maturation protease